MSVDSSSDLIRLCLTSRWSDDAQEELNFILENKLIDWKEFLQLCDVQACTPLVRQVLHTVNKVPEKVRGALDRAFITCGSANLLYLNELKRILVQLHGIGVQPVLLKGAALAISLYDNIALRPMIDIDLLVQEKDVQIASQLFRESGYLQTRLDPHKSFIHSYENEVGFGKRGAIDFLFEIHWNLFDSPFYQSRLPIEWFWQNSQSVKIDQIAVNIFAPEAQLLHLCGHLQPHHTGKELLWLNDIAQFLVKFKSEIDWNEVIANAQKFDLVLPLQLTLRDLVTDWNAPISQEILERIEQLLPSESEKQIFSRMTKPDRPAGIRLWDDLDSLPGIRQKIKFAWFNLFPSSQYMTQHYRISHRLLIPFYYCYRWYIGVRNLIRN